MSKPQLQFVQGDRLTFDWPVEIKWPESAKPGRTTTGRHTTKTCFVTFELVPDSELDDLQKELQEYIDRINTAAKKVRDATDDEAKAEAKREAEQAEADYKGWRLSLLRRVVVGLPDNHNWGSIFQDLPEFSSDLVEAMADFRPIGVGLEQAFWKLVNGGKTGNS
ncbi:MAG TPA: hypothetical protein VD995_03030 [Azospirillum sp.]|nr:hypothetical protein [Azospirillum sp.]